MKSELETQKVLVVGAGLAGSEAANYLASKGIPVVLAESKVKAPNPAQKLKTAAELVCTNSLKSMNPDSGHGVLKYEMHGLDSLVLQVGKETAVPAGDALAVDREAFSQKISEHLKKHKNIEWIDEDVSDPIALAKKHGCEHTIIASGPLTTKPLETWLQSNLGKEDFYFYDAIAPVVDADTIDTSQMYFKDRRKEIEEGKEADYLNVPLNKEQYEEFVQELINAEKVPPAKFEEMKYFESCLPVDLMAERGVETPRFSCMKPVGLELEDGSEPHAVVQLRRENLLGSAYNLVGFQNRLTYREQVRVFRKLPGFQEANFIHLGSVHRNTFLNSRKLLNFDFSSHEFPRLHFAGQITGVEGYTESASIGLYVAFQIERKMKNLEPVKWPIETGIGALVNYVMTVKRPEPSNINFGLLPTVTLTKEQRRSRGRKKIKKELAAARARESFDNFMRELS